LSQAVRRPVGYHLFWRVIVLYVGKDTATIDLLRSVLGDPIAG